MLRVMTMEEAPKTLRRGRGCFHFHLVFFFPNGEKGVAVLLTL